MGKLNWGKRACAVSVLCATTAIALPAQTFTTLHSFDKTDGKLPIAALVQATDGNLYGTTVNGGAHGACPGGGCGTVFKIAPSGTLTTLYSFCSIAACLDGANPSGGLIQATDGNLYGTTQFGGSFGVGSIFEITPSGTLTTLHAFDFQDGDKPSAALVRATDGNFYGTTAGGGVTTCFAGCGTVFKITPSGALTTLHKFCSKSGCTDGSKPYAALVQASDGTLYGTTQFDGAFGFGTVFKITPGGTLTTLYSFCSQSGCTDGESPHAGLVQATDGNLYGTTSAANDGLCVGFGPACGTVFKITPGGILTTLYNFCSQSGCTDGSKPFAALVQATDGNLYGTTSGRANGGGTVFKITLSGTLTTLYSFCSESGCPDGEEPFASLVQDTSGKFYGTTYVGGTGRVCGPPGCGTVFSLSVGLTSFVETQPTLGKVGAIVRILGTNLTGATSVTFNGTAATFTVVSSSLITTNVPSGASTGKVKVTIPSGTLSSNLPFRVLP